MWAGRGQKFHSSHMWPWTSHWTSPHLSREEAMFSQAAFAKFWNFPWNDFYKCTGLCKIPLPGYTVSKGQSCGDGPLWVYGFSRLRRWKWFQNSGIFYRLCHLSVTKGTIWLSYNPVYGPQAFSPSRSLPQSAAAQEMLQPQGVENFCPSDILWRRQRGEGRRLSDKSGSSLQSSPQDTQRWGREENKMWMGGVKGIWGFPLHWPQPSVSFHVFSWRQEEVRNEKATK